MQEEGEVKMVTIKSINEPQDQEHTSEVKCFSAYKISNPGFDSLIYSGKPGKVNIRGSIITSILFLHALKHPEAMIYKRLSLIAFLFIKTQLITPEIV